jgi:hypothetical protein
VTNQQTPATMSSFSKVQSAIDARRNALGDAVWNHIGNEARNAIALEECRREGVNFWLFTKWSSEG